MHFPFSLRHLYLLALFQLVGGPLILLSVMTVTKIAADHAQQHGFIAGLHTVLQTETWQTAAETVADQANATQPAASSETPAKKLDTKEKIPAANWMDSAALCAPKLAATPPMWELPWLVSASPQAPPLPPPRRG